MEGAYGNTNSRLIYGVFSTPDNAIAGSAICAFSLQVKDKFLWRRSIVMLPTIFLTKIAVWRQKINTFIFHFHRFAFSFFLDNVLKDNGGKPAKNKLKIKQFWKTPQKFFLYKNQFWSFVLINQNYDLKKNIFLPFLKSLTRGVIKNAILARFPPYVLSST